MPWVAAGTANCPRGVLTLISSGIPTPSPIVITASALSVSDVEHWGTLFVEVTDPSLGTDTVYVLNAFNLYRKNYRFDIGGTTGSACSLRLHITKKAARPAYLCTVKRFTP